MFDMFDLPPGLREQARTVLLTVLFIFAGKGLLSLMTASTPRERTAEPVKEPAPPKLDKTTIEDSPKKGSQAAVQKPAEDAPPKPKPADDDAQDATSKSQVQSGGMPSPRQSLMPSRLRYRKAGRPLPRPHPRASDRRPQPQPRHPLRLQAQDRPRHLVHRRSRHTSSSRSSRMSRLR